MGLDPKQEKILDNHKGKIIDSRYEIGTYLGKGATGVVYAAKDLKTNKIFAMKFLRARHLNNKNYIDRFINEAQAINLVNCKNIVRIEKLELNTKVPYIISEFVNGPTLKEYINFKKTLGLNSIVGFMMQILYAMEYLHSHGIVHKDIRPQNILIKNKRLIKLTDLGISDFPDNEYKSPFYRDIGAIHYLSPELCSGDEYDKRSDIYSAGVMLYEMVMNKLPFDSNRSIIISMMHIKKPLKPLREINPCLDQALEYIIVKAMAKNPEDRYQSAYEMLSDLVNFAYTL